MIYFAKVKIDHHKKNCRKVQICIKTFGHGFEDARKNLSRLIDNWQDVQHYEILRFSTTPIEIKKFVVIAIAKQSNRKSKEIKLTVTAENEEEAQSIFSEIVNTWTSCVSCQVLKVVPYCNAGNEKKAAQ